MLVSSAPRVAKRIWCATMSLAEYAWHMRWRSSWPRKIQDSVHTTRNTSPVIASTSLVFSLMGSHLTLFLTYRAIGRVRSALSELVFAGLQFLRSRPVLVAGRATILL